jgi:hypothetical protein
MSSPANQWVFLSFVRIIDSGKEKNNTIRVEWAEGTQSAVAEIPAGVYPLGLTGKNVASGTHGIFGSETEDSVVFGRESLLGATITALNDADDQDVLLVLDTGRTGFTNYGEPTGKLRGQADAGLTIKWNHSQTTVDPGWYGVAKTDAVYPDTVLASVDDEPLPVISQMSSTLALVGQRVLGAEPQYESFKEVGIRAGDGSSAWKTFGDGVDQISEFIINVAGLPRDSIDSGFHSLRRWFRQLRFARARRRFLYVPDLAQFDKELVDYPQQWDPDDTAKARRWGWRDLALNPLEVTSFEDVRRHATSNREWQLKLPVVSFRE